MLDADEQAAYHAGVLRDNELRERARTAAANRRAGHPEPHPGDRLYVLPARGLKQRCRAGILFVESGKRELLVVADDATVEPGQVTVSGAEQIFADPALTVMSRSETAADAAALRTQVADRDAEIVALKARLALAERSARQAAKDDPNGGPARLRAGAKAREEFGGKD